MTPSEKMHELHPDYSDRLINELLKNYPAFAHLIVAERFEDGLRDAHQLHSEILKGREADIKHNKNSELWAKYPELDIEAKSIIRENRKELIKIFFKRLGLSLATIISMFLIYFPLKLLKNIHALTLIRKSEVLSAILIKPDRLSYALVVALLLACTFYIFVSGLLRLIDLWSNNESIGMIAFLISKPTIRLATILGFVIFTTMAFNVSQFSVLSSVIAIYALIVFVFPKNILRSLIDEFHRFKAQDVKNGIIDPFGDGQNDNDTDRKNQNNS